MLTLTQTDRPRPISDLAAGLTDQTLVLLSRAGVRGDSVEMELETWRALTDELEREFDLRSKASPGVWGRNAPNAAEADFHLHGVIEQAIHRAALRVAGAFDPDSSPAEIATRVRPGVASLRIAPRRVAVRRDAPAWSTGCS